MKTKSLICIGILLFFYASCLREAGHKLNLKEWNAITLDFIHNQCNCIDSVFQEYDTINGLPVYLGTPQNLLFNNHFEYYKYQLTYRKKIFDFLQKNDAYNENNIQIIESYSATKISVIMYLNKNKSVHFRFYKKGKNDITLEYTEINADVDYSLDFVEEPFCNYSNAISPCDNLHQMNLEIIITSTIQKSKEKYHYEINNIMIL